MSDNEAYKLYDRGHKPTWCIGCGDYGVLRAVEEALASLKIDPQNLVIVSGIGCSGRISGYLNAYTFHSAHGRALPVAEGVKLANPKLQVLVLGGDGDGFAIGLGHTLHAARRNSDLTYVMMTNHLYGLTKGQTSPVSPLGFISSSTPQGSPHAGFNQPLLVMAAGASFVAQGTAARTEQVKDLVVQGINTRGFSYINIFSPCVTFNKVHTYRWANENLPPATHNPHNLGEAMAEVAAHNGLLTGVLYNLHNSSTLSPSVLHS